MTLWLRRLRAIPTLFNRDSLLPAARDDNDRWDMNGPPLAYDVVRHAEEEDEDATPDWTLFFRIYEALSSTFLRASIPPSLSS
jgi:hypothetical protein